MGKIKRTRQKFHSSQKHSTTLPSKDEEMSQERLIIDTSKVEAIFPTEGLFKGIKFSAQDLKQSLPDFDTQSTITSKSLKELHLKKKDKMKLRHELWIQKIDTINTNRKKEKDRNRRRKTAIVGDMQPLQDTLPTLEMLLRDHKGSVSKDNSSGKETSKSIQKEKKRKRKMLEDIGLFQQVLSHPSYKANPLGTISEHLHNKMELEDS